MKNILYILTAILMISGFSSCEEPPPPQTFPVTGISLDKTELSLAVGENYTLISKVSPENATYPTVTWTSYDTSVATVDANGKIFAIAQGTAIITAKAGDKTEVCTVNVGALPTLITNSATNVSNTFATLGGNITNTGAPVYTERGVVYATTQNPTTSNNKWVAAGTGTGNYTTLVTGLTANTTYYVRAYATNTVGTVYGGQVNFRTNIYSGIWTKKVDYPGGIRTQAVGFSIGDKGYVGTGYTYDVGEDRIKKDFWEFTP